MHMLHMLLNLQRLQKQKGGKRAALLAKFPLLVGRRKKKKKPKRTEKLRKDILINWKQKRKDFWYRGMVRVFTT